MLKKIICTLVFAGALTLVGCGAENEPQGVVQNPGPYNINGVWETNLNWLEIDGNRFVLTTYTHQQWGQFLEVLEGDPGFDKLEVGEIDFDTYYILTGRNVGYDVISVEITNVSQGQRILERVPVQRRNISIITVDETGFMTGPFNFAEHFDFYEHEPGFAIIEEKGIERNGDIDFDTFYLLTGIEVNETYVYRIRVLDVFTRQTHQNIMGYIRHAIISYNASTSTQRSGTFILLDDGRKEVIWNDTGNVRVYNFDRTPNTITFAGLRYQRAS